MKSKITLCCGGRGCPVIEVNGTDLTITDDNGNIVKMTKEQAQLIPAALKNLYDNTNTDC
jgi:hypothetical protein